MTSPREHEFKFHVADDYVLPSFDGVCEQSEPVVVEQVATYYDTADLRLSRAGASLRFRDDDGWTVKLAQDPDTNGALVRSEFVLGGEPSTPPPLAVELVAALARTSRMTPVARLHTRRRRTELRTDAGPFAILTDDDCTVLHGRVPGRFREVELEITESSDDAVPVVDSVVTRLRDAGAAEPDPTPKVVRALGTMATAPADVVPVVVLEPASVDAVIRHALSDAVHKLVVHDPVVRIGTDPEGVHQARVATRRLRSHLRTFRDLLDPEWSATLRDELGWLGDELGAVRDADVMLDRLRDRVTELDDADQQAAGPLLDRLVADRDAARTVLLGGLRSERYLRLLDRLVDAARRPRVAIVFALDHDDTLRAVVRKPWKKLRKAVDALPDPAPDPDLHAVRIKAKRARYAAEVVEPAFGKRARKFARALTNVQDVLGEHQDAVVAGAWLRENAFSLDDPGAIYVAGRLAELERAAADASRAEWPKVWKQARSKRLRSWL